MAARDAWTDEQILKLLKSFKGREAVRNRCLLMLGISTGFRISDLLSCRRRDLINRDGQLKKSLSLTEKKTGKNRTKPFNDNAKPFINRWLIQHQNRGFVNRDTKIFIYSKGKRMSCKYACDLISNACRKCGFNGFYGTHSMRKTYAKKTYAYYEEKRQRGEKDIDPLILTKIALNHSSLASTEQYLGHLTASVDESDRTMFDGMEDELSAII